MSEPPKRKECWDRLSELPDSLIHVIFSFLEMRDVVKTTLLSKRYNHLWTTTACLDFPNPTDKYLELFGIFDDFTNPIIYNDLEKFRRFVCGALSLWKGAKIVKFSVSFKFDPSFTSDLDSWIHLAIEKQVEELCINLAEYTCLWGLHDCNYYAPERLYSCSSITKLTLLSLKLNIIEIVRWNQLKSLTIEGLDFLSEHAMNQILSGSPQLEVLNLCIMEISENLNIVSASLKMLKIGRYQEFMSNAGAENTMLRIWAPNLETLEISGVSYMKCLLNIPSVSNAILGFHERPYYLERQYPWCVVLPEMLRQVFQSIRGVEKVTLTSWCIKVFLEMKKRDIVVTLSNAKFLKIYADEAEGMLDVLEMFPNLMMLIVEHNKLRNIFAEEDEDFDEDEDVQNVDASKSLAPKTIFCPSTSTLHLNTVEIAWHLYDASIIPVIETLLENAHMLEKMVLRLRNRMHEHDAETTFVLVEERVLSMPRSSPNAKVIISQELVSKSV